VAPCACFSIWSNPGRSFLPLAPLIPASLKVWTICHPRPVAISSEPRNLILHCLPVCADADVQGCALHFWISPAWSNVASQRHFGLLISRQFFGHGATPFRMAADRWAGVVS
jgi:hypothetical protein